MIKKLLQRLFLFSLPFLLVYLILLGVLFICRESFLNPDSFIGKNNYQLVGYAYNEGNYRYIKWKEIQTRAPYKILGLGASRIGEFRDSMFTSSFYNATFSVKKVNEFKPFFQFLPVEKYPEVLVLCLDQHMFNASYNNHDLADIKENKWLASFSFWPNAEVIQSTAKGILNGKISWSTIHQAWQQEGLTKIGFQAFINEQGYRYDGSKCKTKLIERLIQKDKTLDDFEFRDTYRRIDQGIHGFEYCSDIDSNAIRILSNFFDFCHQHQIKVVAYLPPYADAVLDRMQATKKYEYLNKLPSALNQLCVSKAVEFYDFTRLSTFGSSDNEVIDGFHGGQVAYLKMLLRMLEQGSVLNQYANYKQLQLDLKNSPNAYSVYRDSFD